MRVLIVALLAAISYAQTDCTEGVDCPCDCVGLPEGVWPADPDFANECGAHDANNPTSPWFAQCTTPDADWCLVENWCVLEYCFVRSAECATASPSSKFDNVYYSYEVCGAPNCYVCSYTEDLDCDPEECPFIPDDLDCSCPAACIDEWIGDEVCDRRDTGSDCSTCAKFYEDGDFDKEFDQGDCEIVSTTEDPSVVNVNVVDGSPQCGSAIGVCSLISFQVSGDSVDNSNDNNDYGLDECLSGSLEDQGFFLMQMESGGQFDATLAVENGEVDYIVWGPFRDVDTALATCGELGVSSTCGELGSSTCSTWCSNNAADSLTLTMNVNEGDVYVLMINDPNDFPATVTIQVNDAGPQLKCSVVVPDQFSCDPHAAVVLDFENTVVKRANLGGYAALQSGEVGEGVGIFYANVGYWEEHEVGLRVTTSTPGVYRCHAAHNTENKCDKVQTDEGFGIINMFSGNVALNYEFVYEDGTDWGTPLDAVIPKVVMSVFDIDSGIDFGETVSFTNAYKVCPGGLAEEEEYPYYIDPENVDASLDYTGGGANDFTTQEGYRWDVFTGCFVRREGASTNTEFVIKQRENCSPNSCKSNNPTSPNTLQQNERLMSVEVEYKDVTTSGMDMRFVVSREHEKSRNIMFAGPSRDLGRKCCKDVFSVFDCSGGYKNGEQECGGIGEERCTKDFCCIVSGGHGDPIIHTFHEECYDLHKDGYWLASSHPAWDYDVHVAVYNEYMRQISITKADGSVWFSVNNFGEIINNDYTGFLKAETLPCPEDYEGDDCIGEYMNVSFDAQDLYFDVHVGMLHDYSDPALKKGEVGFHMDIYPQPYVKRFTARLNDYTGLYFHNPLPQELPTCESR